MPSEKPGHYHRQGRESRQQQVVVGNAREHRVLCSLGNEIEAHAHDKQRDGEVDQHHMLSMLRQQD